MSNLGNLSSVLSRSRFANQLRVILLQIGSRFATNVSRFAQRINSETTVNVHDRRSLLLLNGCQMNPFKMFFVMLHSTRMNRGRKGGFRLMAEDFCTSKNQWYV